MDNTNNFINKNKINDKIKNDEIKDNNKIKNNNSNNSNNSNNNFNGLNNHNYNNKDKNFLKMIEILKKKLSKDSTVNAISKEKDEKFRAFKVLISTILSARTKDETTEMVSKRLYKVVKNVDDLINIETEELEKLIYPVGFYRAKAKNLKKLGIMLKNKYNGEVPNNIEELLKLPGVGRKTANLVITLAFDDYGICVDTHVHRICNRWEYVDTENPEDTEGILREKLPKKYWKEINNLLVIFGREVCSPTPKCERCIDKIKSICPYYKKLKYFKEILDKYDFKQVSKNNIPDKTGTYILRIRLKTGKKIKVGKKELFFKRGFYYYVGSAMGKTNNLKRRIERHLRDDKKLHWHIDYLLKYGKIDKIYITEKPVECEVAQDLINYMNYIPKFGCSDCNCESHLMFMKF